MHNIMEEYAISDLKTISKELRKKIIEMVYSAKSGHPGGSLSIADVLTVLYFKEMNIDPKDPHKNDRDILVMSKGHASPALYGVLAMRGFFDESQLSGFRKIDSDLEGHVHRGIPGVETSTGSLGQGLGVAVGFALASKIDKIKNHVYAILGDGEMEEGNTWESIMAGYKFGLNNLIAILDRNNIQLDGFTEDIMPLNDIGKKVRSFGWHVYDINGHDFDEIAAAIEDAKKNNDAPSFIVAHTVKGKGVSYMENNPKYHGAPPKNDDEFKRAIDDIEAM